eukprot:Rhum_TRINITY_DN12311_c0_g1::Rhum_TRINITY_DN12311_c0_g1_i2::g.50929::m.50929
MTDNVAEWKKGQQANNAKTTFVSEGGHTVDNERDLPGQFRRSYQSKHMPKPCLSEKNAVQRCLEKGIGPQCQPLLDAFNACEEKYFTQSRVEDIHAQEVKWNGKPE